MKIISARSLMFPEIRVIRFGRYGDERGYFSEIFRKKILQEHLAPHLHSPPSRGRRLFLPQGERGKGGRVEFIQCNESYSRAGTIRGLHFQWEPPQSKLIRAVSGKIVDLILDIRKGSPTLGKIIAYELASTPAMESSEWLWVPAGFAHGFFVLEESMVEYFCTAEWNPKGEAGISPMADDLDWSLCNPALKKLFDKTIGHEKGDSPRKKRKKGKKGTVPFFISEKDRNSYSLQSWLKQPNSNQFIYQK